MTADQESFVKMTGEALQEWRANLGDAAWIILGILCLTALIGAVVLARHLCGAAKHDPSSDRDPQPVRSTTRHKT